MGAGELLTQQACHIVVPLRPYRLCGCGSATGIDQGESDDFAPLLGTLSVQRQGSDRTMGGVYIQVMRSDYITY